MSIIINKKNIIKVCMIGDGGVGKTSFIHQHRTGKFNMRYDPTMGMEANPLLLHTSKGVIQLKIWDIAGQEKFGSLDERCYSNSNAFIVFFSLCSKISFKNTEFWIAKAKKICPNAQFILVGTKKDIIEQHVVDIKKYKDVIPISSKDNYNLEKPLLKILRHNFGDDTLLL